MDHGDRSERILEKICDGIFGEDLVSRSPEVIELSGAKEFSDVLVDLGETIVALQSKSILVNTADLDDIKYKRIMRKVEDAKKQLSRALNTHDQRIQVRYKNSVGIESEINWGDVKKKVGIVTINLPDDYYQDPEHRFQLPKVFEVFRGMDVHIFILRDLCSMIPEVSTPQDFLSYLEERKWAVNSNILNIGNELDFIGFFKTQFDYYQKIKSGDVDTSWIGLEPGHWESYRANETLKELQEQNFEDSRIVDVFIREIRTCIESTEDSSHHSIDNSIEAYKATVRLLSILKRVERRDLGRKIREKYRKTRELTFSHYISCHLKQDLSILFIAVNDEDRDNRRTFLEHMCVSASKIIPTDELLGVVTQGAKTTGFCLDFCFGYTKELKECEAVLDPRELFGPVERGTTFEWEQDRDDCEST